MLYLFKEMNYYVSGNTSKGYINYLTSNLVGIKNVITLRHPSFTLKTKVLRELHRYYAQQGDIDIIHSPYSQSHLSGLIMKGKSSAIVTDDIATTEVLPTKDLNLADKFKCSKNSKHIHLNVKEYMNYAYKCFSEGLATHDNLEKIFIDEMDFAKANRLTNQFITTLLQDVKSVKTSPLVYHRFFGTTTADGPINVLPTIIKDLSQRVYIKGRAGTGKSVFMKKVARACINKGLDTELYHCSFDPDSLDMVLVPELSFCIFDSTLPHEFSPEKPDDIIIDLYEAAVNKGTDEKYARQISDINNRYKSFVHQGIDHLKQAKHFQDKIENQFMTLDKIELKEVTNDVIEHIL